jgi:hypothetical protein
MVSVGYCGPNMPQPGGRELLTAPCLPPGVEPARAGKKQVTIAGIVHRLPDLWIEPLQRLQALLVVVMETAYESREELKDYGQNNTTEIKPTTDNNDFALLQLCYLPPKDLE